MSKSSRSPSTHTSSIRFGSFEKYPAITSGLIYFTTYLPQGFVVPFLPLWLRDSGLSPTNIGLLFSISYVLKAVTKPLTGYITTSTSSIRRTMVILVSLTGIMYFSLGIFAHYAAITFILVLAINTSQPGLITICEQIGAEVSRQSGIQYGRLRLWASIGFAVSTLAAGRLISSFGVKHATYWIALSYLTAIPFIIAHREGSNNVSRTPTRGARFISVALISAIISATLVQSSNAFLYTFGTIYWRSSGISPSLIGFLWSIGIGCEIVFLAFAGGLLAQVPARFLTMAAGIFTSIRWMILGCTLQPEIIAAAQILQGFTIGLNNIAWIRFVNENLDSRQRGLAIGLYGSLNALGFSLCVTTSSALHFDLGFNGFLVMSAVAGIAAAVAVVPITLSKRSVSVDS